MSLHQRTKAQRKELAMRSDKIRNQGKTVKNISIRLGVSPSYVYRLWEEFGYPPVKGMEGRE